MLPVRYQPMAATPFAKLFDQVFGDDVFGPAWATLARPTWAPMNVRDAGEAFETELALPGMKPEDFQIEVHNRVLTIRAGQDAKAETEQNGYLVREIKRGSVTRAVQLPTEVDVEKAQASYEHGVLKLTLPKAESAKLRTIAVKAG
jgi:HSP20 family protein